MLCKVDVEKRNNEERNASCNSRRTKGNHTCLAKPS